MDKYSITGTARVGKTTSNAIATAPIHILPLSKPREQDGSAKTRVCPAGMRAWKDFSVRRFRLDLTLDDDPGVFLKPVGPRQLIGSAYKYLSVDGKEIESILPEEAV